MALSYRGYAGSTGRPTEAGLIADARAAYDFAVKRYGAERIVLWGESLGTGVSLALAAERPVARVVLEAPFLSAVDIAAGVYPYVPVRWLMKDQFRSDLRVAKVTAPVLVLHGDRDNVVPISSGAAALQADHVTQALRPHRRRRARESRQLRRGGGGAEIRRGEAELSRGIRPPPPRAEHHRREDGKFRRLKQRRHPVGFARGQQSARNRLLANLIEVRKIK